MRISPLSNQVHLAGLHLKCNPLEAAAYLHLFFTVIIHYWSYSQRYDIAMLLYPVFDTVLTLLIMLKKSLLKVFFFWIRKYVFTFLPEHLKIQSKLSQI